MSHERDAQYWTKYMSKIDLPVLSGWKKTSKKSIVLGYVGAKRRGYEAAYHNLTHNRKTLRALSTIKCFIKPDKIPADEIRDKAPRLIQFRTPEFNLMIAAFLKPYEHELYETLKSNVGLRVVAKGLNNVQRAANIVEAAACFHRPVFLLLDHSKFDAHVTTEHLEWIHRQYYRTTKSKVLRYMMRFTLKNRGYTKNNIKYTCDAGRMSGDYDTALGNSMLNYVVLQKFVWGFKSHIFLDGDDSVVIVEKSDVDQIMQGFDHFAYCGFKTECSVVHELHHVEFCRSRLLPSDPPRFARDPIRALSNYSVSEKDYAGDSRLRYLAGIGQGELAASCGVPVLQAFAVARARAHAKPMFLEHLHYAYGPPCEPMTIDMDTRIAFEQAYGIGIVRQLQLEAMMRTPNRVGVNELLDWYNSLDSKRNVYVSEGAREP